MGSFVVSMHSRKRFKERFRLFFNKEIFENNRDFYVLKKLFAESKSVDFALMQRPGEYNALCSKYGRRIRVNQRKNMVFIHYKHDCGNTVLLTVLKTNCMIGQTQFKEFI